MTIKYPFFSSFNLCNNSDNSTCTRDITTDTYYIEKKGNYNVHVSSKIYLPTNFPSETNLLITNISSETIVVYSQDGDLMYSKFHLPKKGKNVLLIEPNISANLLYINTILQTNDKQSDKKIKMWRVFLH